MMTNNSRGDGTFACQIKMAAWTCLMKNVSVTMGLAALLLAGAIQAEDITIKWQIKGDPLLTFYLPKVASDGLQNVALIAEGHTGSSALEDEIGFYQALPTAKVDWSGSSNIYGPSEQKGQAPTIALAYDSKDDYDTAIELHQGGQDSGSSLWFQLGTNAPPSFTGIGWGTATRLAPGPWACGPYPRGCGTFEFDSGYNATVAADNNLGPAGIGDGNSATVVEVHQAAAGESALYYHVGLLTLGASPSISWGPSLPFDSSGIIEGYAPTVSIANNVAVLVSQGSPGGSNLWYSIGAVDTATSTIAWTAPIPYGSGYNPTVSVWGSGPGVPFAGRVLVEAHQVDNGKGSLVYSVGVLDGTSPTSITWSVTTSGSPNTNIPYATGCYPSVALAWDGNAPPDDVSVTETHEANCGSATTTSYWYGHLIGK